MVVSIRYEPSGYTGASNATSSAGRQVQSVVSSLPGALSGLGSSAGHGPAGTAMAPAIDGTVPDVLSAAATLAAGMQNLGNLIEAASFNHAQSDAASDIRASAGGSFAPRAVAVARPGSPPSSAGGTGQLPGWWQYIAKHAGGAVWPDTSTGQLKAAGNSLVAAADSLSSQVARLYETRAQLVNSDSPDVGDAVSAVDRLSDLGKQVVTCLRDAGIAMSAYAADVAKARVDCDDLAASALAGLVVADIPGTGTRLATADLTDPTTAVAAADALMTALAAKVKARLATLGSTAASHASALVACGAEAADLESSLQTFATAGVVMADMTDVTWSPDYVDGATGLSLSNAGPGLPDSVRDHYYDSFDPAMAAAGTFAMPLTGAAAVEGGLNPFADAAAGAAVLAVGATALTGVAGVAYKMSTGDDGLTDEERAAQARATAAAQDAEILSKAEEELTEEQREQLRRVRALVATGLKPREAADAAGLTDEERKALKRIDVGDHRDVEGKYTGKDSVAKDYEAEKLAEYASENPHNEVVTDQARATIGEGGKGNTRYYDGIEILGEDPEHLGEYLGNGLEVKSGDAERTAGQRAFDAAVDAGTQARVKLPDGRIVRIIMTDVLKAER